MPRIGNEISSINLFINIHRFSKFHIHRYPVNIDFDYRRLLFATERDYDTAIPSGQQHHGACNTRHFLSKSTVAGTLII